MQPLTAEENRKHVTATIRHGVVRYGPNEGWFPETDVEQVRHVRWQNEQYPNDRGEYCIGITSDGVIWFHDGKDRIAAANDWRVRRYLYRGIDRRFNALLRDYLGNGLIEISEGDRVINFGANIGEVALALNRKGAKVLAIEPDPYVLWALKANARGRYIDVSPSVAWKADEVIDLHIATEKGDTSVVNRSTETLPMEAHKLDTLYWAYALVCDGPVHLIVGDAEGAEPEVLLGATETLKRTRYVSIRVGAERNGKCPGPECRAILEKAGFNILMDESEILIGENASYR